MQTVWVSSLNWEEKCLPCWVVIRVYVSESQHPQCQVHRALLCVNGRPHCTVDCQGWVSHRATIRANVSRLSERDSKRKLTAISSGRSLDYNSSSLLAVRDWIGRNCPWWDGSRSNSKPHLKWTLVTLPELISHSEDWRTGSWTWRAFFCYQRLK